VEKTSVVIVLHTHMPYVLNQGDWPHGTTWLNEVVLESYVPLLNVLNSLKELGIQSKVTISTSPILNEQLLHPAFPSIVQSYVRKQINQAERDIAKFSGIHEALCNIPIGNFWKSWYSDRYTDISSQYSWDLTGALRRAQEEGLAELMSTSLTHAYLPLLSKKESIDMQIASANVHHRNLFGETMCMWLPECGYDSSTHIVNSLLENHVRGIVLDQSSMLKAMERSCELIEIPKHLRPLRMVRANCNSSSDSIAVLIRHSDLCSHIWDESSGFPAQPVYLDFHKREYDSSLRYWKVTDRHSQNHKLPYERHMAIQQAEIDAEKYRLILERYAKEYRDVTNEPGVICLAFDTELFGHWWFEGPVFLQEFIRQISSSDLLKLETLSSAMQQENSNPIISLDSGSWGKNGTDETWNNIETKEMWAKIHEAEEDMDTMLRDASFGIDKSRILNQALRELMLLQSSDWTWLVSMHKSADYAIERFNRHHERFRQLLEMVSAMGDREQCTESEYQLLASIEQADDILRDISIQAW